MIKRVLIPLDGSELAELVIPHLLRFSVPQRTEFLLMTALSPSIFPSFDNIISSHQSEQMEIAPTHENIASERVHAISQQLKQHGFKVESKFLSGMPADSILRLAEQAYVDLIAMSTHGRTGLGLALLGSVADEVLHNAHPPIFLVPARVELQSDSVLRTILLPLDGTPVAEAALPVAHQFAQDTGAIIHLLRVAELYDTKHESAIDSAFTSCDDFGEQPVVRQATCYLERIHSRLQLAGIASRCQVVIGDPADTIVRIACADNVDVIVMSTHGRSGVERMVYGSVVSQVISNTLCPLLLVRGKVRAEVYEYNGNAVSATFPG